MKRSRFIEGAALFAIFSIGWTWYAGKDLNWDFLNYHFYGPYLLLDHRLGKDYFAGSLQSYLNPIGYVPLYLMIKSGWNSIVIGAALGLIHSLNFSLLWLITDRIVPNETRHRAVACLAAVFLAFLAPLQLTTLGGTFLDPVTSLPVLAAVYLLTKHAGQIAPRHAFWMGIAMGAATGVKLTNLLLLPAFVIAIEAASGRFFVDRAIRRATAFSAAVLLGFVLTHGYWSYELWREMGNPVFPLFNNIFQSPDFPLSPYQDRRHLDAGLLSILTLPFEIMGHRSWIYSENIAADARPFALCIFLLILLATWHRSRLPSQPSTAMPNGALAFRGVLVFVAASYLVWAATSRIGRYAFVIWLLVGPLTVATLMRLPWKRAAQVLLTVTILVQLTFLHTNGNPRWSPSTWEDKWLDVQVPEKLQTTPFAYLTIGSLSFSATVPFFNERARFANLAGQYIQPAGDQMTPRLREFISSDLRLKVFFSAKGATSGKLPLSLTKDVDAILSLYDLRLADSQCDFVKINTTPLKGFESLGEPLHERQLQSFAVCDVSAAVTERVKEAFQGLAEIDAIFDRVELACPMLTNPRGVQTMRGGKGWMRAYFNSVSQLFTDGEKIFIRRHNSFSDYDLGNLSEWRSTLQPTNCASVPPEV